MKVMNNKLLDRINISLYICNQCHYSKDKGKIEDIIGIKDEIQTVNKETNLRVVGKLDMFEVIIPQHANSLSLVFFIRTLDTNPILRRSIFDMNLGMPKTEESVITQSIDIDCAIEEFDFPKQGEYALEVYKYWGEIDVNILRSDNTVYRRPENFLNAVCFTVK